ncbi:MAG: fibrillarin-like rRNA/tRNA 2'-O-methyltransferase [Candidatus ainarchaeum sp.]|nr:fibrillarin-like rRNA/tRNA 2'-O-methyltransferase [Candidatus ainarchaeum sp.]
MALVVKLFEGVFSVDGRLATENMVPGARVYGEKLHRLDEKEYREWDPYRSKLAGAIRRGLKEMPVKPGINVLYLGASTGTTPSHVSDILGAKGTVFCVEISATSMRQLLPLSEKRENLVPILGDARRPDDYKDVGKVDVIYQDVAQPDQDDILIINAKKFLKKGGFAMLCIKSQSIDVLKSPRDVFALVKKKLEPHFDIVQEMELEPFDKDHLFIVLKKK